MARARPDGALDVIYLSVSGQLGGAERALLDMVAGLRARYPAARVGVLIGGEGPLEAEVRALGAVAISLRLPGALAGLGDSGAGGSARLARLLARAAGALPATALYVARLRRVLRRQAPTIIHSNGFKMHVLGALAAPRESRLIWHLHDYTASRRVMARLLRLLASRCTAAIANSRSVADDGRRVLGGGTPVTVVYNAVDLERFAPIGPRADLDALAGLEPSVPGTVRVGLVATLAWWKGHDVFLRAIARLPAAAPVRAYVVSGAVYETRGSQASLDALRDTARRLGVADRVGFTGFVAEAPAVMRALDVVVHASTQPEPFGLVIAEAMACGRAVVVSAAGGAEELVRDGVTALTFPPGDADALAARLATLVGDATARARLGAAARAAAERQFARQRLAAELAEVYSGHGADAFDG